MIGHERARDLAAAAIDFDLAAPDAEALAAHLASCEPCRAIDDGLRADAAALSGLDQVDAPADLRERILAAAAAPESIAPLPDSAAPAPQRPTLLRFPDRIPARFRRPAALVAAAAVIIAVVGGTLAWRTTLNDSGGGVAVVDPLNPPAAGSGDPGSGDPGSGAPSGDPGQDLVATTWDPVAALSAEDGTAGVVGLGTSFRLASVDGTPASVLARRLTVKPPLALSVTDEADGTVRLTPDEPLTPGAVYRFTLEGEAGQTVDTWAFQARQPLRVVGTLPEDTETGVPLDTGIEITFDQDGVVDAAAHVTIEPAVKGRFEQHDRVLAFVPERLAPATVYTVTVSRGIAVEGTGEVLEEDTRFRFETAAADESGTGETTFRFANDLFEAATAERPTIALWFFVNDANESEQEPPTEARLEIYRLADQDAAIDAFQQLRAFPRWSQWNAQDRVPTDGLQRVVGLDARLQAQHGILWTRLPEALPAGWYLVEHPSPTHPAQAILQVTDIAGYLVVSETQTLVWANDLASGKAIVGAMVATGGTELGRTGDDGTLLARTPDALLPASDSPCTDGCEPVITVRAGGRSAFLPTTGARDPNGRNGSEFDWSGFFDEGHAQYWRLFHTDRTLYRRTDTVNVWGALRDRDTGEVPARVTVRLVVNGEDPATLPSIARLQAIPRPTGAFTGSIALDDVPEGSYLVELLVGDDVIAQQPIQVDRILKPAYRLEVVTGRRVYIAGDRIRVTATASFFEGTPVPGVPLRISGFFDASPKTDATGTAIVRGVAATSDEDESGRPEYQSVHVTPARAEEGEIAGATREFVVYPSSWTIQADSEIRGGRVRLTGGVNVVDVERLEAEIADGMQIWELDPRGAPVRNRTVTASFIEIIPVRTQTGTEYDFIEKKVVPVYEYDYIERPAGTLKLRTGDKGTFSGSIAASGDGHDYQISLRLTDPDGHAARTSTSASEARLSGFDEGSGSAGLNPTTDPNDEILYGIGDRIDLTVRDPDATAAAADDRQLYYLAQRGLREATVRASSRFETTFPAWAAPNLTIRAVRFTGTGYIVATSYTARFRAADRAITVGLTADATRYAPADPVTLQVSTRGSDGDPLPATVVLRAVDEKLFSIGGAETIDPLVELYDYVSDGIRATYASHMAPPPRPEGGDTTGGGRDDLRDSVLFKAVETGPDGRASVTFRLSDDLTSWRVGASAVGAGLEAGEGTLVIPVGLPFFVDTSMAPEYLVSDRPAIQVRAFGTSLEADEQVTFSVDVDSLGLHLDGLKAKAFASLAVPLPELTLGIHKVTVTATTGSGATARSDRLTRSFSVVASRLTRTQTTYRELSADDRFQAGIGLTEIVVSDASAGRHLPLLLDLSSADSARLERALAADLAASLVAERFGGGQVDPSVPSFDGVQYQTGDGGIAVVPHASSDLEASVLAAIVAPQRFDALSLRSYLRVVVADPAETRERRNFALAGLAGLGAAVLPDIAAAADDPELTIRERLMLGLGAAALGDAATARSIAASLVEDFGEAVSDQARLRVGDDSADVTTATALMAMLTAANGDPMATRFWAYVEAHPGTEAPFALHAIGYVQRTLEHQTPEPARFAYTIDDERVVVDIEPGEGFHLTLTAGQLAALRMEPLEGKIGVTSTWREAVDVEAFETDPDISIKRTVTPSGRIGAGDLVVVELEVKFGPLAPAECHRVTDLVPSGLLTVGTLEGWVDPETGEPPANITFPLEQTGQRVIFCAGPSEASQTDVLRYVARVVTTGTYSWEAAIVESRSGPDRATVTPSLVVEIR